MATALALAIGIAVLAPHDTAHAAITAGKLQTASVTKAQAASVTKASAFKYKKGLWIQGDEVKTGKFWAGTKKFKTSGSVKTETHKKTYGYAFEASGESGGSSWGGGIGYNCGSGIYITGYKGAKNAKVVVPDKINGTPVVCISLESVKLKSLDLSKCKHLKALHIESIEGYASIGSLVFGKCPQLKNVYLNGLKCTKLVNITPKNVVSLTIGQPDSLGTIFQGGWSFDSTKLQYLSITGYAPSLNGLPNLKELNLCFSASGTKIGLASMKNLQKLEMVECNIKTIDVSKNKKLKSITAYGNNFTKSTVKALKKWKSAKKGRVLEL